jgi:two-component system, NarL family, response regulator DegU
MTRILVIDDNHLIRRALRQMIQTRQSWEVCGEGRDGQEAVVKHAELNPNIIVMDINMPTLNGLQAARQILKDYPSASILILSISDSAAMVEEVRKAGIKGFCSKNTMGYFFDAVETILRGETYFLRQAI